MTPGDHRATGASGVGSIKKAPTVSGGIQGKTAVGQLGTALTAQVGIVIHRPTRPVRDACHIAHKMAVDEFRTADAARIGQIVHRSARFGGIFNKETVTNRGTVVEIGHSSATPMNVLDGMIGIACCNHKTVEYGAGG